MRPRSGQCRGCGRPVMFAQSDAEGLMVLEVHESAGGPGRYAIYDDGIAHPVPARREVLAHAQHACEGLRRYREGVE